MDNNTSICHLTHLPSGPISHDLDTLLMQSLTKPMTQVTQSDKSAWSSSCIGVQSSSGLTIVPTRSMRNPDFHVEPERDKNKSYGENDGAKNDIQVGTIWSLTLIRDDS